MTRIASSLLTLALVVASASASAHAAERKLPLTAVDEKLVGEYVGKPWGFQLSGSTECKVSFQFDHEWLYGQSSGIPYFKIKLEFNNYDYALNFLEPQDLEFLVSGTYILGSYPNESFEVSKYVPRRGDYKAIQLEFQDGELSGVNFAFGHTGDAWSGAEWGWLDALNCSLK